MRNIITIVILGLTLAVSSMAEAKELLVDPSFEEGWDKWTNTYNPNNWSPLDLPDGKKALRCWWDGSMKQVVPVTTGKTYEFKASVSVPSNGDKENWACWLTLDWYDANKNKMGTAWTVAPQKSERGKWVNYNSGKQIAPEGAAFACIDFGVYQSNATPANPTDFDNFSLEEIK